MHFPAHAACRSQLHTPGRLLKGFSAKRKQILLQKADLLRRFQFSGYPLFCDGDSPFPGECAKPLQAEIHRREEPSIGRRVFIGFHGKRYAFSQPCHVYQLGRKRRRNHIKAVDKNTLPFQNARAPHARTHFARRIFGIGQLALHALLIGRIDFRRIPDLFGQTAPGIHPFGGQRDLLGRHPASFKRCDERRHFPGQSAVSMACRALIGGQAFLFLLDYIAEHHPFSALVKQHVFGLPRPLKHAPLQPAGRQHVDQERSLLIQACHHVNFCLKRVLRGNQHHACLARRYRPADSAHAFFQQPVRPARYDLHKRVFPLNVSRETLFRASDCFT